MGDGYTSITTSTTLSTSLLNGYLSRQTIPRYTSAPERNLHIAQVESSLVGAATTPESYMLSFVAETGNIECYNDTSSEDGSATYWRRLVTLNPNGPWFSQMVGTANLTVTESSDNPVVLVNVSLVPKISTYYVVIGVASNIGTGSATLGMGYRVNDGAVLSDGRGYTSGTHRQGLNFTGLWDPATDSGVTFERGEAVGPVTISMVAWIESGSGQGTFYPLHTTLTVVESPSTSPHTEWL